MLILTALLTVLVQNAQGMNHRGAAVMGFDQAKTEHHFLLYTNGGAIDILAKDKGDNINRDAIRSHLPHIAKMFGDGDFEAPVLVHDTKNVPGIAVLTSRKDRLTYSYVETPQGGRLDIVTSDAQALKALHEFLRYQIKEHQTGDPGTPTVRR
jgi:hypothetical protein